VIIGLTGKNAAGKGEVVEFLKTRNFEACSLSDAIREEIQKRGKDLTRENLIRTGNDLRGHYGPSVLADRILTHFESDKNYVVDSIRNPAEVNSLRRRRDFTLVEVTAEDGIRFKRIKERSRENDPQNLKDFLELDAREESENKDGQQLTETARLADAVVENNGSLGELRERILELIQKLSKSSYRPDWDEYFMNIAKTVALRSSCIKRKVAAVIVKDKRIVSTGYNGTPRGITNCNEGGCPRCNSMTPSGQGLAECICSHAEENAVAQAAYHGVSIKGASLYITYSPCISCAKIIINSGIEEVVYNQHYSIAEGALQLLRKAGLALRSLEVGGISDKNQEKAVFH